MEKGTLKFTTNHSQRSTQEINCRKLWRSVLALAITDLFYAKSAYAASFDHNKQTSIAYIFTKNEDFDMVCEFCEYSPDTVRRKVKDFYVKYKQDPKMKNFRKFLKDVMV